MNDLIFSAKILWKFKFIWHFKKVEYHTPQKIRLTFLLAKISKQHLCQWFRITILQRLSHVHSSNPIFRIMFFVIHNRVGIILSTEKSRLLCHIVWKLLKMSHLNFGIFANFCPIKINLSGNTVWPQASGFQKLAKMDHFWNF